MIWLYITGYLCLLAFVCYQLFALGRRLRSAAWKWITAGFVVSFILTVASLFLRRDLIGWGVWGLTLLRSYGALVCIVIGLHKLRNDLRAAMRDVSLWDSKDGE